MGCSPDRPSREGMRTTSVAALIFCHHNSFLPSEERGGYFPLPPPPPSRTPDARRVDKIDPIYFSDTILISISAPIFYSLGSNILPKWRRSASVISLGASFFALLNGWEGGRKDGGRNNFLICHLPRSSSQSCFATYNTDSGLALARPSTSKCAYISSLVPPSVRFGNCQSFLVFSCI